MAGLTPTALGILPPGAYAPARGASPAPRPGQPRTSSETGPAARNPFLSSSGVIISFSPEGLAASAAFATSDPQRQEKPGSDDLTPEEEREVERLQQRDREVRQHEQAHVAAGGQYVQGGARYVFTRGPDNRQYATGGEVSIDVSPESTPEATIQKARVVRRAALAPAEPSAQDRRVAARASQLETQARQEINKRSAADDGKPIRGIDESARANEVNPLEPAPAPSGSATLRIDLLA